jgi:hypothetical protein
VLLFDLLGVSLVHGWLVDPQDEPTARALGDKSYNELVEQLVLALGDAELERLSSTSSSLPPRSMSMRSGQASQRTTPRVTEHDSEQPQQAQAEGGGEPASAAEAAAAPPAAAAAAEATAAAAAAAAEATAAAAAAAAAEATAAEPGAAVDADAALVRALLQGIFSRLLLLDSPAGAQQQEQQQQQQRDAAPQEQPQQQPEPAADAAGTSVAAAPAPAAAAPAARASAQQLASALLVRDFLDATSHQLTVYGLAAMVRIAPPLPWPWPSPCG